MHIKYTFVVRKNEKMKWYFSAAKDCAKVLYIVKKNK